MKSCKTWLSVLVGLVCLILAGHHCQALPVAAADNKVVVYPTADEKIGQLNAKGFQKVTNYGSYWLVEATDAQVDQLTQLYGARAVKENRLNRIQLSGTSFDTTSGDPEFQPIFARKRCLASGCDWCSSADPSRPSG